MKTIVLDAEMKITTEIMKNTDVLKEIDGNPPQNKTVIEATAGLEIATAQAVNKNIIVSAVMTTMIEMQIKKHQVQKF